MDLLADCSLPQFREARARLLKSLQAALAEGDVDTLRRVSDGWDSRNGTPRYGKKSTQPCGPSQVTSASNSRSGKTPLIETRGAELEAAAEIGRTLFVARRAKTGRRVLPPSARRLRRSAIRGRPQLRRADRPRTEETGGCRPKSR